MPANHAVFSKSDYVKAHSFNLIQAEKTNCEVEHVENVGKINSEFYSNKFPWQVGGLRHRRELHEDVVYKTNQDHQQSSITNGSSKLLGVGENDKTKARIVESRVDLTGSSPKRYVSTCYIKPRTLPVWYTESVLIKIGSTKRVYDSTVWFKPRLQPYYWSERMTTNINFPPAINQIAEVAIPVSKSKEHFISLDNKPLELYEKSQICV